MRHTILFFLLFISTVTVQAQTANKHHKKDYYVYADTGFISEEPDRGAWLKAYYENDTLKRIEAWYGFNFGDLRREFYYWNNKLIVVLETQRLYNNSSTSMINGDSVKPNYEGRYLFKNDSLTSVKQTGHFSFLDTSANKQTMQNTFLKMSSEYMSFLDTLRANKKNRIKMKHK